MSNENVIPTTDTTLLRLAVELNRDQLKDLKAAIPPSQNPSLMSLVSHLQATPRHDEVARIFCIQALGQTGEPAVLSSLLTATGSRSKEIRKAVAIALANIHHPMSAYLLLPMLLDDSARVRKTAMRALMQLGQPSTAESILAAALSDLLFRSVFTESLQQLDPRQQRVLLDSFEAARAQAQLDSIPQALRDHISSPKAVALWENYAILAQSADTLCCPEEAATGEIKEFAAYGDADSHKEVDAANDEHDGSTAESTPDTDDAVSDQWTSEYEVTDEPVADQDGENEELPAIVRTDNDPSWRSRRTRHTFSGTARSPQRSSHSSPVAMRSKSTLSVSRRTPTVRTSSRFASSDFSSLALAGSMDALSTPVSDSSPESQQGLGSSEEKTSETEPTYAQWFQNKFLKSRSITFVAALYLHLMLLLLLATVYLAAPETFAPFSFNAVNSEDYSAEEGFVQLSEAELDLTEMDLSSVDTELTEMSVSTQMPMVAESTTLALPSMFLNQGESSAPAVAAAANPGQQNAPMGRVPAGAVSAGSFSVWTIPDNPDPGEPYKIVIQMRVPDGTDKYSISDLEGVVVGSDGYQKLIPGGLKGFLPVIDGRVQMEVHIVSADENVEDTVFIRSRLLREAQRLQIRF